MRTAPLAAALGLCLAASAPAAAQRMMGRGDRDEDGTRPHRGLYAALGLGAGLQMPDGGNNVFGFLGEARIGFSFNRTFQIFLSADSGGGSQPAGFVQATNFLAAMRLFLYADESIGAYVRGGLGLGLVSGPGYVSGPGANTLGLAEAGGVGLEIRLDKHWSISPEGFFRRTDEGSIYQVTTLGIGLLVNYN